MSMTEPVYLDYDSVVSGCLAESAGKVRYRKRPPDVGCLHARVTFGTPHRGLVDVACDEPGCGHEWRQVKVVEVPEPRRRG